MLQSCFYGVNTTFLYHKYNKFKLFEREFGLELCNKSALVNDFNIHRRLIALKCDNVFQG